jgi:flavin reductase (DIM6/NTAB) family NADH-FMN oxidoreductase RutF
VCAPARAEALALKLAAVSRVRLHECGACCDSTFHLGRDKVRDDYGAQSPRPIAWVTTVDLEGIVNAAPFSFFNLLGASPPIVGICPGDRDDGTPKDTARNVRLTHDFVVNLVDENVAEAMNRTAASLPAGVSELHGSGLTTLPSSVVRPPRIAESPASLECAEWGTLQIGDNRLVIGLVKRLHVREELIDMEKLRIRSDLFHPVGRMASPNGYCRTRDRFEMLRPR